VIPCLPERLRDEHLITKRYINESYFTFLFDVIVTKWWYSAVCRKMSTQRS